MSYSCTTLICFLVSFQVGILRNEILYWYFCQTFQTLDLLRNGKHAGCNHRVVDARRRHLSTKEVQDSHKARAKCNSNFLSAYSVANLPTRQLHAYHYQSKAHCWGKNWNFVRIETIIVLLSETLNFVAFKTTLLGKNQALCTNKNCRCDAGISGKHQDFLSRLRSFWHFTAASSYQPL